MHSSPQTVRSTVALFFALFSFGTCLGHAAEPFAPAQVAVYFSPYGGATEAVIRALNAAKTQVLMQAYSFTSAPIAKALIDAHKRGVKVIAILDKSNETAKYSAATFLNNAGIPPLIDDQHAIAHNKVMVIDSATILTGSFNFTKAAEAKNAENLLVIKDAPELVTAYVANIQMHAGHSHLYGRQASASSARTVPAAQAGGNGEVHGNKHSKIYHLPTCPGYTGMNPASRITFSTEAEAQQAGYRKAKNCP